MHSVERGTQDIDQSFHSCFVLPQANKRHYKSESHSNYGWVLCHDSKMIQKAEITK